MTTPSESTTTPPPIVPPDPPITLQPSMFYDVSAGCVNAECPAVNIVSDLSQVWSNADGNPRIGCAQCGSMEILTAATLMNPQPVMS